MGEIRFKENACVTNRKYSHIDLMMLISLQGGASCEEK